jgi:DNA-binding GntR family transcriptional regulator
MNNATVNTKAIQPLAAVTRRSLVVDALREAILSGELRPGAKITEMDLVARLQVSRGPIREGIRELINEGLLFSQPYTGTYVTTMDEKTIAEAYGLRRVLEKYAFTLVWPRRDTEFKRTLMRRYEALLLAAERGGAAEEMSAEIDFHSVPYEFAGDSLLMHTWRHVTRRMQLCFILHRAAPDSPNSLGMHERFLELAMGENLELMHKEIDEHMDLGLAQMRGICMAAAPARNAG